MKVTQTSEKFQGKLKVQVVQVLTARPSGYGRHSGYEIPTTDGTAADGCAARPHGSVQPLQRCA